MAGCRLNELHTRGESEFCVDVREMDLHGPQSAGLRGRCLWVPVAETRRLAKPTTAGRFARSVRWSHSLRVIRRYQKIP